ncbi:hypothetical protein GCM10009603_24070 [Nocardiopsis exhalans]
MGCDGDTAAFAVATLRSWWTAQGSHRYPHATRVLITADAGGSNGYRVRAWKKHLADFAHQSGLEVTVCHFPPGTSKWNKIEHRLFSAISTNWRGRPLTGNEVVVNTIGATTTRTGLRVHAAFDPGSYPTGVTVPDALMDTLPLAEHGWHGTGNYTLRPQAPAPRPVPRQQERTQPQDRAPAWQHHVVLTGLKAHEFDALPADVERYILDHPPISPHHKRARHRTLRRGPLSLSERLLVTPIHYRRRTRKGRADAVARRPRRSGRGNTVPEIVPVLDGLRNPVSAAPNTALTGRAPEALVGRSQDKN